MSNLANAIYTAALFHGQTMDKSGQPYIFHPLRVAMSLEDETDRIVAVLHDLVEDTEVTLDDLAQSFSKEVVEAVDALTRRGGETYTDFILRAKENNIAKRVKVADILDNLRPGGEHLRERYHKALEVLET